MDIKNFNTGNFIKLTHVEKAFNLVKLQMENDNFSFKTLELEIYRKEGRLTDFDCKVYYEYYIQKDIFYNSNDIFYSLDYFIPKGLYGVREFDFLSFEMLILYYSLGFYVHDLVKESYDNIEEKKSKKSKINTFYGGKINFDTPKNTNLFYHQDYISFNKSVNENIEKILKSKKKAVIIKLDIQDYFKTIDLDTLLKIISKYAVPSNTKRNNFDTNTLEEIKNILLFISRKHKGIPLFSQNIISNFLSYIYLFELDNYVQNLSIYGDATFVYSRYVDDFYLTYKKNKGVENSLIGDEIFNITTGLTEFISERLCLKINYLKTQTTIIEDQDEFKSFIDKEKNISIPKSVKTNKTLDEKLEEIETIIKSLKKKYKSTGTAFISSEENNKLKEIFSSSFKSYLNSKNAKIVINRMFSKWNPILTLTNTQAILFLLKHSKENKLLKNYIVENFKLRLSNPHFLYLLEKFILSNTNDQEINDLLETVKSDSNYFKLISKMNGNKFEYDSEFSNLKINNASIQFHDTLMQQIKMLRVAEIEGKYNLAFNHLLNIYHFYCFVTDPNKPIQLKNYNQNDVSNFVDNLDLSCETLNFTVQFFDRRNKNNISHPGEELMENWMVNKSEYLDYKEKLNHHLIKIDVSNIT